MNLKSMSHFWTSHNCQNTGKMLIRRFSGNEGANSWQRNRELTLRILLIAFIGAYRDYLIHGMRFCICIFVAKLSKFFVTSTNNSIGTSKWWDKNQWLHVFPSFHQKKRAIKLNSEQKMAPATEYLEENMIELDILLLKVEMLRHLWRAIWFTRQILIKMSFYCKYLYRRWNLVHDYSQRTSFLWLRQKAREWSGCSQLWFLYLLRGVPTRNRMDVLLAYFCPLRLWRRRKMAVEFANDHGLTPCPHLQTKLLAAHTPLPAFFSKLKHPGSFSI